MGQQNSQIDPDTPPQTLSERSLDAVAKLINDGHAKRIVVLTGAGISTAAGIPDFRSPGTGLYNNLARLNLPHPEAVFDIDFFEKNPYPFYLLAKELYPGNFHPTISHVFVSLLARKGLLRKLFTQNIDCLERSAGVPPDRIVEAHGSFATQRCVDCKAPFPDDEMRAHVARGEPAGCPEPGCRGIVKPDIVFFGEQLPATFFENKSVPATADLMLVLGTSLSVQPFASLPLMAMDAVPRVLFNLQRVGDLGSRPDDVLCLGDCDSGVRRLADALGWRQELESRWEKIVGPEEASKQRSRGKGGDHTRQQGDGGDEVDEIAGQLEDKLKLGPTPPPPDLDQATQDIGTDHHRGQEKEKVVGDENHGEDGRHPHTTDAPPRAAPGITEGDSEVSPSTGGSGGVAGGVEAEDSGPKTETTDEAAPSSGAVAPSPPSPSQQEPPTPKKKVMIATENNTVIETPSLSELLEREEFRDGGKGEGEGSEPLWPHVVPDDATEPAAYSTPTSDVVNSNTSSYDGAAQPLETLPALGDPPKQVKRSDQGSGISGD